jgi:hypothetical protein
MMCLKYTRNEDLQRMNRMTINNASQKNLEMNKSRVFFNIKQHLQTEKSWEKGLIIIIEAISLLGFERGSIFLVNPVAKTLDSHIGKGTYPPEKTVSVSLMETECFAVNCVREKKTIHITRAQPKLQFIPEATSSVWVPILVQNEVFGVLMGYTTKGSIQKEAVTDLEKLAEMCANFIEKTHISVQPKLEKKQEPEKEYHLDNFTVYIVAETRPKKSFAMFCSLVAQGAPGLVVTRTYPKKIKKEYNLTEVPFLWLSQSGIRDSIDPTDLSKLNYVIGKSTQKCQKSVILIDGLEYLITHTNFENVLGYLIELKKIIEISNSWLIIPLHKEALLTREYNKLKREFIVLDSE